MNNNQLCLKSFLFCYHLIALVFSLSANLNAEAQSDSFILEAEQHWAPWVGGTVLRSHNLAVADIDGNGMKERITGAAHTIFPQWQQTPRYAPLKIWN